MKRVSKSLLLIIAIAFCNIMQSLGQNPSTELPIDKNVRIGKLSNGLTYYIRHNALPEKRVNFYIAQKVGSILEEPQQRGLAHFLEHMAFNGTKNFPGDKNGLGIIPWCETKGIKFGRDLNAYTDIDETVYNIDNVPTENSNVVDSCLLILHDWSSALLLSDEEIDKERGVIREEWRSRTNGMLRILTSLQPQIYEGSKYTDCIPIGNIDVINNFPYKELRNYYAKWYRPDLQGIVIVGDINVDEIEAKIKKTFADVKAPVNPAERTYYKIGDNKEPIIVFGKDKEVSTPLISVNFKHDPRPISEKQNISHYVLNYVISMATTMLNSRLSELGEKANAPYNGASSEFGKFFFTDAKKALALNAECKADGIELALKTILEEGERAKRFGFTASEYERARANYLKHLEASYNERNKKQSESYAKQYVRHFLDSDPIPGIEYVYTVMSQIAPSITVETVNQIFPQAISEENQVVLIAGPDKEEVKYPTKETVINLLKGMKSLDLKPYVDQVSDKPLMAVKPKGGKIVSEKKGEIYGSTKLTLSNGVVVYVKQTDHKADEILFKGVSFGGTSHFPDKDAINISQLNSVALIGGLGEFNNTELTKVLAGKRANVNVEINRLLELVKGNCSPKDFETLMQLTYLAFTAPHKDDEAFVSYKNRLKAQLQNADANPMTAFSDSLTATAYGNNPRKISLKADMVDKIDYDRILEMYKDRMKDANDFTFYFVGNVDLEKMKPLIAEYLGALPVLSSKETFKEDNENPRKGYIVNDFEKQQQTPTATIFALQHGLSKYNLKNLILTNYMDQLLKMVYNSEIREKEGGTYGVQCWGELSKYPKEELFLNIYFQTDPAKKDKLIKLAFDLLDKMAKEGPSSEHMQKVKEYMLKSFQDNQKENGYWLKNISEYFFSGVDETKDYVSIVNSITSKDIQMFFTNLLKQKNRIQIIMTAPKENKK